MALTRRQREDFAELGSFHLGRVSDDAELAEIRAEYGPWGGPSWPAPGPARERAARSGPPMVR